LKGLVLRSYYTNDVIELFKVLSDNSTNQLRRIQFDETWDVSKEALNDCFENWKQKEKISFDFYIPSYILEEIDYQIDVINRYQELGVIRDYEIYHGTRNYLEDWE
jgi:hypothetical protein